MTGNSLTKIERICSRKTIERLFAKGRGAFVYPLRYVVSVRDAGEGDVPVSVMVSVPKRNHKRAVKRNLLKRRVKEAYRTGKHDLCGRCTAAGKHLDIAFIYVSKEAEDFKLISHAVERILKQVGESI